jgi:hypothetical protein
MDAVERRDRKPDVSRQGHTALGWFVRSLPSAGIYAGPAAWLISTQANYALVPWVCAHQVQVIPIVAVVMAAFSLFGGLLSWRGYVRAAPTPEPDSTGAGRPHRFVALIGVGIALLFTAIIIVHGIAGVVFHGCER